MSKMLEDLAVAVRACDDANGHAPLSDTELDLRVFIKRHHATITDMAKRLEAAERDAARYRWLREHFRFANDSLREIWFDAHTRVNQEDAKDLDKEIDAALQESGE